PGDWYDPVFWDLVGQNGCRYLEIFGPLTDTGAAVSHNAFAIAPSSLTRALDLALPAPIAPGPALTAPAPPQAAMPPPEAAPRLQPLAGEEYLGVLARLHAALAPRAYLEIGTLAGDTLALARCPAIAIDPAFRLDRDIAATLPLAMLFEQTADDFFAARDPAALLGAAPDLVLIDGMHRLEFALRDLINCERHADPRGVIVLHDCVPLDLAMARRDQADPAVTAHPEHPGWWTGDVWKLLPILRRYRPDLELLVLDAPPTGLVLLRRLNPGSTVLADRYGAIVAEALGEADEAGAFARHLAALDLRPTARLEALLAGG
ncbi:MAG: class I SAM-dependent methyltransferase, partial [Rhodospirillales bacterium]|nr:class I SAM-dependent methyltransferase [Rhodospirillales bacterium]